MVALTRYDRERLAELVGAVSLAGHAVPVMLLTKEAFSIPMEAGGLILAPLLGIPAVMAVLGLVAGALLLAFRRPGGVPMGGLVVTLSGDLLVLTAIEQLRHPLLVLGALLSATSLGFFVSLVNFQMPREHRDLVVTAGGFLLVALLMVTVVPRLAGL